MSGEIYFTYKGKVYLKGTMVKLRKEYRKTHLVNGEIFPERCHFCGGTKDGSGPHNFWTNSVESYCDGIKCSLSARIPQSDIEYAIEEIIKPRYGVLIPKRKKKDWECPEVMAGWGILAVVLFVTLIFKQFYIAWFWAIFYFFVWRQHQLWED